MNEELLKMKEKAEQEVKPLLKRVSHNYLPVSDLQKALAWYMKYLGLKHISDNRTPRNDGGILILGNGQWLFLLESKSNKNANFVTDDWEGDNYEMFSLTFETDDIITLHASLRQSGTHVEPIVDLGGCGLQFKFKDPDGNKFNVWQDPDKGSAL
ncbi:VOC family protein [Paenibacillus lignilyticus]|uniref:VOC family protein n=1 Tax=Paenibacillus lignilyticus TaxID=1172615 RepID=A0ABS5CD27_9BACL|nr:VOC family protein [Paenibacillus lignilyticus]MBP3961595.1 VOC family protein [Paenibacillus lignilyticus]MBP3963735.1 VOC family protein [Paenibacillus lignilyticus]